MNNEVNLIKSI